MDIKELMRQGENKIGERVTLKAWVKNVRDSKNVLFLEINDGSKFKGLQVVVDKTEEKFQNLKLNLYSGVEISGTVVASPGENQSVELQAEEIHLLADSDLSYPLQKKRHSFEFLREIGHLRARTNTFQAVFRVRSLLAYAIHKFFNERGFVYVHTPIITGSDAEGAGEMFRVTTLDLNHLPLDEEGKVDSKEDFFGKEAGLTVSGQLEGEA